MQLSKQKFNFLKAEHNYIVFQFSKGQKGLNPGNLKGHLSPSRMTLLADWMLLIASENSFVMNIAV